jgi:hypothetical protein
VWPGRYLLYFACAGSGSLQVTADFTPADKKSGHQASSGQSIDCTDRARATSITVDVDSLGPMKTTFSVFGSSVGRFGFAYEWVNATNIEGTVTAEADANNTRAFSLLSTAVGAASNSGDRLPLSIDDDSHPAGAYRLSFACAGPGGYGVTVRYTEDGPDIVDQWYACSPAGRISAADLHLARRGGFVITAVPDATAFDRAGWAYALTPVA